MNKQTKTLVAVGAVAVVGYLLFMQNKKKTVNAAGRKMPLELGAPQNKEVVLKPFEIGRPAMGGKKPLPLGNPQGGSVSMRPALRMGRPLGFAD